MADERLRPHTPTLDFQEAGGIEAPRGVRGANENRNVTAPRAHAAAPALQGVSSRPAVTVSATPHLDRGLAEIEALGYLYGAAHAAADAEPAVVGARYACYVSRLSPVVTVEGALALDVDTATSAKGPIHKAAAARAREAAYRWLQACMGVSL